MMSTTTTTTWCPMTWGRYRPVTPCEGESLRHDRNDDEGGRRVSQNSLLQNPPERVGI